MRKSPPNADEIEMKNKYAKEKSENLIPFTKKKKRKKINLHMIKQGLGLRKMQRKVRYFVTKLLHKVKMYIKNEFLSLLSCKIKKFVL